MVLRFLCCLCVLAASSVYGANYPIQLGDEKVIVQVEKNGPGKVFVHLHQNETTALKAAKSVVQNNHGTVITLKHRGQRNIVFNLNGWRYEFDPNRMFTDGGIKKSLATFGPYSNDAHKQVKRLSSLLKSLIPAGK
jgi:hypothetical protein